MSKEPISKFSIDKIMEMCKTIDTFSDKQKVYLDNETVKTLLEQKKNKLPEDFSFVNFLPLIKRIINNQIGLESAKTKDVVVFAVRDRITRKYIQTQDAKELRKKKIYAFCQDDGIMYDFEHWGDTLNNGVIIKPFMRGEITFIEDHFKLASGFEGMNLEVKQFILDKTLTQEEIESIIVQNNLSKSIMDFGEDDTFQFVIIRAKINSIWRIRKTFWNPATEKLEPKEEFYNHLEPSLNPKNTDLTPVMRFDLQVVDDFGGVASAEFRQTKFGVNEITLDGFVKLLQSSADSQQDSELRNDIATIYGEKHCYFMGLLRKYDPNYINKNNETMTILTLDLGTVIPALAFVEDAAIKKEKTEQSTLDNQNTTTTFDGLLPTREFIDSADKELKQYIPLAQDLRKAVTDRVKKEYGEDILNDPLIVEYLDTLYGKEEVA